VELRGTIESGIRRAQVVALCFSRAYAESENCVFEVRKALELKRALYPIRAETEFELCQMEQKLTPEEQERLKNFVFVNVNCADESEVREKTRVCAMEVAKRFYGTAGGDGSGEAAEVGQVIREVLEEGATQQIEELRLRREVVEEVFAHLDTQQSGRIGKYEIARGLQEFGFELQHVHEWLEGYDASGEVGEEGVDVDGLGQVMAASFLRAVNRRLVEDWLGPPLVAGAGREAAGGRGGENRRLK
jgi:DNA-binding TFAR19-related protein (PDSD5 family)